MRLLIYGINYSPELTGVGRYTGEMAPWLAARGHEVRVVTAPPYYPSWRVGDGYRSWRYAREPENGLPRNSTLNVRRCPLYVPRRPTGLKRLAHLASFAGSSGPVVLSQALWRPDVVLVIEPTIFCAPTAWWTARMAHCAAWLHVQDLEVDAAFEMDLLSSPRLRRAITRVESFWLRRFDRVSTISTRMQQRLACKGVSREQQVLFPNWVDVSAIFPLERSSLRAELGIRDGEVVALYSGNLGKKQAVDLLLDVARRCSGDSSLRFVICGDGPERDQLLRSSRDLANVFFLPLQPAARLNDLLALADIHLLSQRASAADLVMPSKLCAMLASGRPVVATAAADTEVAQVVNGRGLVVAHDDARAMEDSIRSLACNAALRAHLGAAGRGYAVSHLDRDRVLRAFEAALLQASGLAPLPPGHVPNQDARAGNRSPYQHFS